MRRLAPLTGLLAMAFAAWFDAAQGQWLAAALMLVLTAVGTWLYTRLPIAGRSAMDEDEHFHELEDLPEMVAERLEKSRELLAEVGPFRVGTPTQVFCALCQTWCAAEVMISDLGDIPAYGIMVAENQAIHLHCNVTLHVHDHECMPARLIVADLNRAHREGR